MAVGDFLAVLCTAVTDAALNELLLASLQAAAAASCAQVILVLLLMMIAGRSMPICCDCCWIVLRTGALLA